MAKIKVDYTPEHIAYRKKHFAVSIAPCDFLEGEIAVCVGPNAHSYTTLRLNREELEKLSKEINKFLAAK